MKKKIFILNLSLLSFAHLLVFFFCRSVANYGPAIGLLIYTPFVGPLYFNGYIMSSFMPQGTVPALSAPPRIKWRQCVLTELLAVLEIAGLLGFLAAASNTQAEIFLSITSPALLVRIYANVIPEYSLHRGSARVIFIVLTVQLFFLDIILLSSKGGWHIAGMVLPGLLFVAWVVSLFVGYRCHVKALEYPD